MPLLQNNRKMKIMRLKLYTWGFMLALGMLVSSCLPEDVDYVNINEVNIDSVTRLVLRPNHYTLATDGISELELNVVVYKQQNIEMLASRIGEDWIEYYTTKGDRVDRYYTNSGAAAGDSVCIYAQLKGYDRLTDSTLRADLRTDTMVIHFRDPAPLEDWEILTYPVVFHIVQTADDIKNYGEASSQRILEFFDKLNRVFARECNVSANGTDTKIRFRLAEYDPYGQVMMEKGINRYVLETGTIGSDYDQFITSKKLNWDYHHYLNIWLISGAQQPANKLCKPSSIYSDATGEVPAGLSLTPVTPDEAAGRTPQPYQAGIVMNLKDMLSYNEGIQDIAFYAGRYFGLLDNFGTKAPLNYCADVFAYAQSELTQGYTKLAQGTDNKYYYFQSENVMDDPIGLHRTVSIDQAKRIRFIARWCPDRQAWQSDFAFTGE